jgi:hypothetical protein
MGIKDIKAQEFTIKVKGEITGEEYFGKFKALPILPHGLQMEQDKLRRQYLGERPEYSTPRARNQAEVFAQLHTCIVDAPKWWTESQDGMALFDDSVAKAVVEGLNKMQNEFVTKLKKDEADAKADLKKLEGSDSPAPS